MTRAQVYRRVIIPNAAVVATPTLINSLIGLTKGTSLAFSAGVVEVFAQAQILGGADYRYFERFISVALVYWVVNIGIESLGRFIERKMAISAPDTVQTDVKGRPSLMIKISNLSKSFQDRLSWIIWTWIFKRGSCSLDWFFRSWKINLSFVVSIILKHLTVARFRLMVFS